MVSPSSPEPASPPPRLAPAFQRLLRVIAWMVILGGGALALIGAWPLISRALQVLLPFLVALVFAYMCDPIVTFAQRRLKLSRIAGMILFYLALLLALGLFFALVLPALYRQTAHLIETAQAEAPARVEAFLETRGIEPGALRVALDDWMTSHSLTFEGLARRAMESPGAREAAQKAASGGLHWIGGGLRAAAGFISAIFSGFGFLALVIVIHFYLLLDFARIRGALLPLIPVKKRDRWLDIGKKLDQAVGGFLRGQVIDCALVGLLTTIGLFLLGLREYAIVIGFLTGAANFIPYLGPLIGGVPATLIVLLSARYGWPQEKLLYAGLVIALFALVQTIDGFVFQPKIVGKSAQLHPLAVMLALVIGAQFGVMGMIVAVPAACIARVLWKELYWDERARAAREAPSPESPEKGSAK